MTTSSPELDSRGGEADAEPALTRRPQPPAWEAGSSVAASAASSASAWSIAASDRP